MTMRIIEWAISSPLDDLPAALVRLVHLGPTGEPYYRAVTANPDPEQRHLIGYYWTADDAKAAVYYLLEQGSAASIFGGGMPKRLRPVAQKPPPHLLASAA